MSEFVRSKEGLRYNYGGLRTTQVPDALPPVKFPVGINIRGTRESSVQTRPGQELRFTTSGDPITDISTFAALSTDNKPRIIARDSSDRIWLNNTTGTVGVQVGTMTGSGAGKGVSMIPFRPNASPTPYMYIANGSDYKKYSAPDSNVVSEQNVGIQEPPITPDAALLPNLSTSGGPAIETLRPTTFENPTFNPGTGATGGAWTNPGDAIDGVAGSYAFCNAEVGPASPLTYGACKWYGWTAATFPYTSLNLIVDVEVALLSGAPTVNDPSMGLDYSIDGGVNWVTMGSLQGASARQQIPVNLPPSTDLTQLQVRAVLAGRFIATLVIELQFRIYDIKIVGENSVGFFDQTGVAADWIQGGTAGAASDVSGPGDTAIAIIQDPYNPNVCSIGYTSAGTAYAWQVGQTMYQSTVPFLVLDVMQPAIAATIKAIYYFSGTTGRCIIVPENLSVGGAPQVAGTKIKATPFLSPSAIASLRRGAMLQLNSGESVYVLSVTVGPDNTICIETSTVNPHVATETITALPTLVVFGSTIPALTTMDAPLIQSSITTGTGYLTRTVNFFSDVFSVSGVQDADYLHLSALIDAAVNISDIQIQFDVGDGSFTKDYFYYTIRPSDLANYIDGLTTQIGAAQVIAQRALVDADSPVMADNRGTTDSGNQLAPGASQRTEFLIPIGALTRVGTSVHTIINTNAVRIQVICSGNVTLQFGSISSWGGQQPDVGQQGVSYFYRVRPRNQNTGVVGNPSPATRYGVNPLRMGVSVVLPSAGYTTDTFDTWDIFRYGGSILSWRYIGSTLIGAGTFTDNYSDDAALAGNALDFDNFQPWPSIDLPLNGIALQVVGTVAVITSDRDITSYLPGTLVRLNGLNVYTLQTRPTLISGTSYLLQFIENAGALTNVPYNIQEPVIAQRRLPYMWGPDASGTVFACGDQLRLGTLYYAKNYTPDSAPDSYNLEVVGPSEPLLGGELLDGLAFVGSSERWWALYPTPDNPAQRFNPVQQPFLRGLAAPFGHCNDGQALYWWAKDGIQSSTKGSLTDADLYNLFPHEGVVGKAVTYGSYTFEPPDYKRAATFRMAYANYYLYAIYQDSTGAYHCLVLDTRRGAWSEDRYTPTVPVMFHPAQQAGTVLTNTERYDELLMGTLNGKVAAQVQGVNDLGGTISAAIATFEYPGDDVRAPKQWGDVYIDATPASVAGLTLTPMSGGAAVASPSTLPTSARIQQAVSVGGIIVSQFLGLLAEWTDDYTSQDDPTEIHLWQPSFAIQPARTLAFTTFGTSYGITGFMHIQQLAIAYVSTAPITITITSYDGQSPAPLVLPSTGGAYQKAIFQLTPNKGQLYRFAWSSASVFQLFLDDCEIHVGEWGRTGPYSVHKDMGGMVNAGAAI